MAINKILNSDYNIRTVSAGGNVNITTNSTNITGTNFTLNTGNNRTNTYITFLTANSNASLAGIRWNPNGIQSLSNGATIGGRLEWSPDVSGNQWFGFTGISPTGNIIAPSSVNGGGLTPASINAGNFVVTQDLVVSGNAYFSGDNSNVVITGNLYVEGNTTFIDVENTTIANLKIYVASNVSTIPNAAINGAGLVIGQPDPANGIANGFINFLYNYNANAMSLDHSLIVQNSLTVTSNASIVGNLVTEGNSNVTTNYLFANNIGFANGDPLINAANTAVLYSGGNTAIGNTNFTWDNANANLTVLGNIISGSGNLVIANTGILTTDSELRASNVRLSSNVYANGNLSAGNIFSNVTIYSSNLVMGNGNATLGNISANVYYYNDTGANITGGSNTQIQYNNNGRFKGSAAFTFDESVNQLTNLGNIVADNFVFANGLALTSGTPPAGVSNNFQYNQNGVFAGAPTFNYDIANANVISEGNLVAGTKTQSLVGVGTGNLSTANPSSVVAVAGANTIYVAVESPTGNIATSNANTTISGTYVRYRFAADGVIPAGAFVNVSNASSANLNGSFQVVNSGPGYANVVYPGTRTGANTYGALLTLPTVIWNSTDGATWTSVAAATSAASGLPASQPKVKYDPTSGIFYTYLQAGSTNSYALAVSTNGSAWTFNNGVITGTSGSIIINDITYDAGSGSFVAVGTDSGDGTRLKVFYTPSASTSFAVANVASTAIAPLVMRGVAADGSGRFVAVDSWGIRYTANVANLQAWTTPYTSTVYATNQSAYPYSPIYYDTQSANFIWANNSVGSSYLLQQIPFSNVVANTTILTANAYIADFNQAQGRTTAITTSGSTTRLYTTDGNSLSLLYTFANLYSDISVNATTNQVLLSGASKTIAKGQLITAGGGNVYAGNVIATANVSANILVATGTGNLTIASDNNVVVQPAGGNLAVTGNITVSRNINLSNIANINVHSGNVGQFVGVNTANVLTFIDRVSFANLNLGTATATTALIDAALPANLANNQQNGSMVFNTDTNVNNTQPLYIYLNGSWRQMLVSQAL